MIVNEADYSWYRHLTTVPVGTTVFEQPMKIYAARGDGALWLDEAATEAVTSFPVAVDAITVTGGEMRLIGEQGRGCPVSAEYLNTSDGMTLSTLERTASEVVVLPFPIKWSGAEYTEITLYGNGRIYINGVNAIRVHSYWLTSYMGALNGMYTQIGTTGDKQFYKIRFDGSCYYTNTTDAYKSVWELFFLDDGSIFINDIYCPTYSTSNYFYINSASQTFTVNPGGSQYIYATSADDGVTWSFDYLEGGGSSTLFLVRKDGTIYTAASGTLTAVDETELTAAVFLEHGFEALSDFTPDGEYSVLSWSAGTAPTMTATVKGTAYPQELTCTVELGHPSITGIQQITAEYSGTVELCHRTDGAWTEPVPLSDWVAQDKNALYNSVGADGLLHLKFYLYGGAEFTLFRMTFTN